jgi:rRNA maturation protein Nop10
MLIRPLDAHQKYREYLSNDLVALQKEVWIDVDCPVCKSPKFKIWCEKDFLKYKTCSDCGLVYLSPRPNELSIENYYKKSVSASFFHEHILLAAEMARKPLFQARWKQVQSLLKNQNNIQMIDYGSSIGSFLKCVDDDIPRVGVELNEWARAYANKCKINTFYSLDAIYKSSNTLTNFLTAWEVLAHVTNWDLFNEELKQVFQKGGIITLTTPNIDSIEYQILGLHHPNVQFPFLQFFSPKSIRGWLLSQGFEIEEIKTPGQMDLETIAEGFLHQSRSNWPNGLTRILYDQSEAWVQFRQLIQDALVQTGLSGHMFVAAYKK